MSSFPIAVLISGGGSTLKNLIERKRIGELSVDFALVVSSSAKAKGLDYAREANIPTEVISRRRFPTTTHTAKRSLASAENYACSLLLWAGIWNS